VHPTLEFPDLLRLIEERSNAFRALVAAAPDLDVPVPTCPGWTLFDLAQHVGQGTPPVGGDRGSRTSRRATRWHSAFRCGGRTAGT
jgi:hypothetical protein